MYVFVILTCLLSIGNTAQNLDYHCHNVGRVAVFFPVYLRMSAPHAFNTDISLMWEQCESKCFDVVISPAQIMPSHHALNFTWGEQWVENIKHTVIPCVISLRRLT